MPRTRIEYGGLLGDEALQPALAATHCGFDDLAGGEGGVPDVADLALVHEVGSAPSVSSMSVSG